MNAPAQSQTRRPSSQRQPATAASGRVNWADCAKGLSIIGVCLMHVVTGAPGGTDTAWGPISSFLDPVRMPLFFLVSGLFAHRVITRNLEDLWYRRLWFLLVPYLIFTPFQAASRFYIYDELTWQNVVRAVIVGDPGLWFLYTLMVYNIAAVVLRRQPPWLAVTLSFVPALVAAMSGLMVHQSVHQAFMYGPIFFIGLHYRWVFFQLARRAFHLPTIAWALLLFAGWEAVYRGMQAFYFDGWDEAVAGQQAVLALVRTVTAAPMGVIIAVWLSRIPVVEKMIGFVGRHTLPVYVSHHATLTFFDFYVYPRLWESHPAWRHLIDDPNTRIIWGLLICIAVGGLFYGISKIPVLKWCLYPPPLRRRTATPATATV